ncbi:phage tail assembly protein [Ralstonia chuxiongensis]|uniref:Phage tail assembly protein n=1 Tax=Ralstonia chuxiongensis TaxID=2957504 RepID=A0AA41WW12_9RALS|nr:phage tail assembly protein [Ralstonia chuxiongensis]MCP1174337.1 phage tail assembly protein [Ralstonia chuxiongensis]
MQTTTIKLKFPATANGVKVSALTLRQPTVRDMRIAGQQSGGDEELREILLFASVASVGQDDIEGLTYVDYQRVQRGYFRLLADREAADAGPEAPGQAPARDGRQPV